MNGPCESCHQRPAVKALDLGDHGPAFLVCQSCADAAEGWDVPVTVTEISA